MDLITFWLFEGLSSEDAMEMEIFMTQPPPNAVIQEDDPLWSADAEMAMFSQMLGT